MIQWLAGSLTELVEGLLKLVLVLEALLDTAIVELKSIVRTITNTIWLGSMYMESCPTRSIIKIETEAITQSTIFV